MSGNSVLTGMSNFAVCQGITLVLNISKRTDTGIERWWQG